MIDAPRRARRPAGSQIPRPRLVILSLSPLARDARVLRQIHHAAGRYEVVVVGWGALDDPPPGVRECPVDPVVLPAPQHLWQGALVLGGRILPALWERWYWRKRDHQRALALVASTSPDLIHANEAIALPIAVRAAGVTGARVLFDAHEYSPDQFKHHRALRLLAAPLYRYLLARYAPAVDAMITVAPSIAERYARELARPCDVILNAPAFVDTSFRPVSSGALRLVHHGVALPGRRIDRMIDGVALSDQRHHLDLMLVPGSRDHLDALRRHAARVAPGRVTFAPPVPPDRIVATIAGYDIGVMLIPPSDYNYTHALPNKLFESLMAGLAIVTGPSPEMARLVREHGCGVVVTDFTPAALARALDDTPEAAWNACRARALAAARRFNAESEMARLESIYQRLLALGRRGTAGG